MGCALRGWRESNPHLLINSQLLDLRATSPFCHATGNRTRISTLKGWRTKPLFDGVIKRAPSYYEQAVILDREPILARLLVQPYRDCTPNGIRTRVSTLRGLRPRPLVDRSIYRVLKGFEPILSLFPYTK